MSGLRDWLTSSRGRWLLRVMAEHDLHLLNGTCPEINRGMTFQGPQGSSTPDLVWVSTDVLKVAEGHGLGIGQLLEVAPVLQHFSDHAALGLHLPLLHRQVS